jgi:HEAT repeat protein
MKLTRKSLSPRSLGLLLAVVVFITGCSSLDKARSLHQQGQDEKALAMAIKFLGDGKKEGDRLAAIGLIASIGGPKAGEAMMPLLFDKSVPVRNAAITAVGDIRYTPAIPKLIDIALSATGDTLDAAAGAIRKIGPPAIDQLVKQYTRTSLAADQERYKTVMLAVGPSMTPAITKNLAGKTYFENRTNFELLIAFKSPEVANWLLKEIDNDEIADHIVDGLTKLGRLAVLPVMDKLAGLMDRENQARVKERLITVLGNVKATPAIDLLEAATRDVSDQVRESANLALKRIRGF